MKPGDPIGTEEITMTARTELDTVDATQLQAETAIVEASKQGAPMVQRLSSHRDRIDLAVKELESERFELISRRDHLRRQVAAMEQGFALHLEDIEDTLAMYKQGVNLADTSGSGSTGRRAEQA